MAALNWCIFRKLDLLFIAGPKMLALGSHSSANFQPILDCSIPKFKLKYEDSEADRVNTVILNLHEIKHRAFLLRHPVEHLKKVQLYLFVRI